MVSQLRARRERVRGSPASQQTKPTYPAHHGTSSLVGQSASRVNIAMIKGSLTLCPGISERPTNLWASSMWSSIYSALGLEPNIILPDSSIFCPTSIMGS